MLDLLPATMVDVAVIRRERLALNARMSAVSEKALRLVLPVPHLNVTRVWDVGRVRFHPAGTASDLLAAARTGAPASGPGWYADLVDAKGVEFDQSTLAEVTVTDIGEALSLVTDAVAVLRVVQRLQHPMVDVRAQTFGLPGQVTAATVHYLDLTATPAMGWRRLGAVPGWTLTDACHDAWTGDAVFRFLNEALTQPEPSRTSLQRRALVAIDLFNQAWLSWQPDVALMNSAMALEVLLGEPSDRAKKFRIARRVSYFVCGWPNERYPDGQRLLCPYLTLPLDNNGFPGTALRQLINEVESGTAPNMFCSQFFDVLDLYDARNTIVHAGRLGISAGEEGQATWYLASWLLRPVLTWFAEHPAAELADLDAEIASPPPTASNRAAVAPPPP